MRTLKISIAGDAPLIMHDNKTVDPLNRYTKMLKEISGIRNKTDEHHRIMGRIEWEASLYVEDRKIVIPSRVLDACFWNGAKVSKLGKQWQAGVVLSKDYSDFYVDGKILTVSELNGDKLNAGLDKYYEQYKYRTPVRVGTATIIRTRPLFINWEVRDIEIFIDDEVINYDQVVQACHDAGRLKGLCDERPKRGRFTVKEVIDNG